MGGFFASAFGTGQEPDCGNFYFRISVNTGPSTSMATKAERVPVIMIATTLRATEIATHPSQREARLLAST